MADQSKDVTAPAGGPEEHGTRLRNNALNLLGNVGFTTSREVFQPEAAPSRPRSRARRP